jgi:predicted Zn finger-like uncharacterized protein
MMIIKCENCNKKFELEESLIPDSGRLLKCSNCENTWFFTKKKKSSTILPQYKNEDLSINQNNTILNTDKSFKKDDEIQKKTLINENLNTDNISDNNNKIEKLNSKFNFNKILSFFLVILISLIALVILLDTFKVPLSGSFPELEIILYNLYETIKDIYLFLKNLFI